MPVFISQELQHGNSPPSALLLIFCALLTPFVPATFFPLFSFCIWSHPASSLFLSPITPALLPPGSANPKPPPLPPSTENPFFLRALQDSQAQQTWKSKHLLHRGMHCRVCCTLITFFPPFLPIFREFSWTASLWHKVTKFLSFFPQKLENSTKKQEDSQKSKLEMGYWERSWVQTFWHKKSFVTEMIKTRYNIISTALAKLQSAELNKWFCICFKASRAIYTVSPVPEGLLLPGVTLLQYWPSVPHSAFQTQLWILILPLTCAKSQKSSPKTPRWAGISCPSSHRFRAQPGRAGQRLPARAVLGKRHFPVLFVTQIGQEK